MTAIPPRFDITPAGIDAQVAAFYARVRAHEVLGPVFARHVTDWPAHEAKIASFWRNAILHERGYQGRPQQVHMQRPEVLGEHFPIWLDLFEKTAREVLSPPQADAWNALARRIGEGMRMGVEQARTAPSATPLLR